MILAEALLKCKPQGDKPPNERKELIGVAQPQTVGTGRSWKKSSRQEYLPQENGDLFELFSRTSFIARGL